MDPKLKFILLKTVQDDGILPITSVCNMACQFCSHRNNPPGLEVYRLGHLDLELIRGATAIFSSRRPGHHRRIGYQDYRRGSPHPSGLLPDN